MKPGNNSHNTNLYKSNTIVMFDGTGGVFPVFVEARDNSNEAPDEWAYTISFDNDERTMRVHESELRPMTFREFAWFRHPLSGKLMVGRNPALNSVFIHLVAIATLIAAPYADPWWAPVSITVGMIAGFWFFTFKQFNGTQV